MDCVEIKTASESIRAAVNLLRDGSNWTEAFIGLAENSKKVIENRIKEFVEGFERTFGFSISNIKNEPVRNRRILARELSAFEISLLSEFKDKGPNKYAEIDKTTNDVKLEFTSNDPGGYERVLKSFNRDIADCSIFHIEYDGTKIKSITSVLSGSKNKQNDQLNRRIHAYKLRLLDIINEYVPITIDRNFDLNDDLFTDMIVNALSVFEEKFNRRFDIKSEVAVAAHDAYVILKYFDVFLENSKIIKTKEAYKNSATYSPNMYIYDGPKSNPPIHWGDGKIINAAAVNSPLVALIFDNMPVLNSDHTLVNKVGNFQNTVGSQFFMHTMAKFKSWLYYNQKIKPLLDFQINELRSLFNQFVSEQITKKGETEFYPFRISRLSSLYGIREVFNSDLDDKTMSSIWQYLSTNEEMLYDMYQFKNGKWARTGGQQRLVSRQELKIMDKIQDAVYRFSNNQAAFSELCKTYNIKFGKGEKSRPAVYLCKDSSEILDKEGNIRLTLNSNDKIDLAYYRGDGWVNTSGSIKIDKDRWLPAMDVSVLNDNIKPFIEQLLGMIPNNWIQYTSTENLLDLFAQAVGTTLLASNPGTSRYFEFKTVGEQKEKILNTGTKPFKNKLNNLAEMFAATYKSDITVTLKNLNGDSIPAFSLTSWIQGYKKVRTKIEKEANLFEYANAYQYNFVYQNYTKIGSAFVRRDILKDDINKQSTTLSENEVMYVGLVCDFFESLFDDKNDFIHFQSTTNSDKATHWIIPYGKDIKLDSVSGERFTLKAALQNIITGEQAKISENAFITTLYNCRKGQYTNIAKNLIADFSEVFGFDFEGYSILAAIDEIKKFVDNSALGSIEKAFAEKGVQFWNELHVSKNGGFNLSLYDELKLYCGEDDSLFRNRIKKQLKYFVEDLIKNGFELNLNDDKNIRKLISILPNEGKDWIDYKTGNVKLISKSGNYNPLLIAYFLSDTLLSTEFNKMTDGFYWAHDGKYKPKRENGDFVKFSGKENSDGSDNEKLLGINGEKVEVRNGKYYAVDKYGTLVLFPEKNLLLSEDFYIHDAAKRLFASYKRTVINGASIELYVPKQYGISDHFTYATVKDLPATVWNMMGVQKTDLDSMDGSTFAHPIFSILCGWSSPSGKINYDNKTICGDISAKFGMPFLIKHAEFALTNNRRQMGYTSDASVEHMYQMMSSIPITKFIKLEDYYGYRRNGHNVQTHGLSDFTPLYTKDPFSNKYYLISNVSTNEYQTTDEKGNFVSAYECEYTLTEVDANGKVKSDGKSTREKKRIRNLYDMDQILGGAFCMKLGENGLEYYDGNTTTLATLVCEENLKDSFLSYMVNNSANKVGNTNVNGSEIFNSNYGLDSFGNFDYSKIKTATASTYNLGKQMNPDHELDFSQVSEMSQMISALIQGGHFTWLVNQIYEEIGKVAAEAMRLSQKAIDSGDPKEIYKLLGENLIEAFEQGNRDTTGLAQSFLVKAKKALNDNNIEYEIPFSAPTINATFVADVVSAINKKGIRRKYSGVASILVPSYNMIQYYRHNGKVMMFEEFAKQVFIDFPRIPNDEETNAEQVEKNKRHIQKLMNDPLYAIQNGAAKLYEPGQKPDMGDTVIIPTIIDEDNGGQHTVYQSITLNSYDDFDMVRNLISKNTTIYNWTVKPKDLRQSDTTFTVNDITYSMYDLDSVRALHYIRYAKKVKKDVGAASLGEFQEKKIKVIKNALRGIGIEWEGSLEFANLSSWERLLKAKVSKDLEDLDHGTIQEQSCFYDVTDAVDFTHSIKVENVQTRYAEMIMGRLHAKELGLRKGDDISTIKELQEEFFERRLKERNSVSGAKNVYDYAVTTSTGHTMYITIRSNHPKKDLAPYRFINKSFSQEDTGIWYNHSEKITDYIGDNCKIVSIQNDAKELCPLVIVDTVEEAEKILSGEGINFKHANVQNYNFKYLAQKTFGEQLEKEGITLIPASRRNPVPFVLTKETLESFDSLSDDLKEKLCSRLQDKINENNKDQLKKLAKQQWLAFKKQLFYVGARIPTQSMQSFQALELIGFSDSDKNEVYVPRVQTWLQGSDYDIDKLYILSYNLAKDGKLPTFSKLQYETGLKDLTPILRLKSPNGKEYFELSKNITELEDGQYEDLLGDAVVIKDIISYRIISKENPDKYITLNVVSVDQNTNVPKVFRLDETSIDSIKDGVSLLKEFGDLLNQNQGPVFISNNTDLSNAVINGILRSRNYRDVVVDGTTVLNSAQRKYLGNKNIVYVSRQDAFAVNSLKSFDIINRIMESKSKYIRFDDTLREDQKAEFLRILNKHTTNTNNPNKERALQNAVIEGILNLLEKTTIQKYGHNPISIDELRDLVVDSLDDLRMSMDNPITKFIMQVQNMVGKEVIGISAVTMKVFFAASTYMNRELDQAVESYEDCDDIEFARHLSNILFVDKSSGKPELNTMANLNLKPLKSLVKDGDVFIDPKHLDKLTYKRLLPALNGKFWKNGKLSVSAIIEVLEKNSQNQDAAQNISELLSAATDNAKELILAKINATSEFADFWGALLMTGHSFKQCDSIMRSPFFNEISNMSKGFTMSGAHSKVTSKNVIKFMTLDGNLPSINNKYLRNILGRFPSRGLNLCFYYKLLYETDENGNLLTNLNGKKIPITGKATVKDLIKRSEPLYFYKKDSDGNLTKVVINEEYIKKIESSKDLKKEDIRFWLTTPETVNIFISHLRNITPDISFYRQNDISEENEFIQDENDSVENEFYLEEDQEGYEEPEEDFFDDIDIPDLELRNLLRYAEKFLSKRAEVISKNSDSFKNFATVVSDVMPIVEEQSICGLELSVNQGIPTNEFDFYNKLLRIENFINSHYGEIGLDKNFDIVKFIEDKVYREDHIQKYETIKFALNPLAVIAKVPNFAQMFDFYGTANKFLGRSCQFKLDFLVAKQLLKNDNTKRLNVKEFKAVHDTVKDSLILSWLKSKKISIKLPENQMLYLRRGPGKIDTYYTHVGGMSLELTSSENLATFKRLMEDYIFPKLKQTFRDNEFVRIIDSSTKENKLHEQLVTRKRMPMDMMSIDDTNQTDFINSIMKSFGEIADNTEFLKKIGISDGNMKLGNLLYLYNLYVYKDSFSQDGFTRLFEVMNVYNNDALVSDYYKYLSTIDHNLSIIDNIDLPNSGIIKVGDETIEIKINNVYYRCSVLPNADTRIGVTAIYNNGLNQIQFTDQYGNLIGKPITVKCKDASDFMLELPFSTGDVVTDEKLKEMGFDENDVKQRFRPNSEQVWNETMDAIDNICGDSDNIEFITDDVLNSDDSPIKDLDPSMLIRANRAYGFIYNGKIYINQSRSNPDANTKLHELAHGVCAVMKFSQNKEEKAQYYTLIDNIYNAYNKAILIEKAKQMGFKNIYGSDFKEELLVDAVATAFKDGIDSVVFKNGDRFSLNVLRAKILDATKRMLDINIDKDDRIDLGKLGNTNLTDIVALFGNWASKNEVKKNMRQLLERSAEAKAFKQHLMKNTESEYTNSKEGIYYTC